MILRILENANELIKSIACFCNSSIFSISFCLILLSFFSDDLKPHLNDSQILSKVSYYD